MVDLPFGNSYEALLFLVAIVAAIPYGIWQLIKKLSGRNSGGTTDGNARTGR